MHNVLCYFSTFYTGIHCSSFQSTLPSLQFFFIFFFISNLTSCVLLLDYGAMNVCTQIPKHLSFECVCVCAMYVCVEHRATNECYPTRFIIKSIRFRNSSFLHCTHQSICFVRDIVHSHLGNVFVCLSLHTKLWHSSQYLMYTFRVWSMVRQRIIIIHSRFLAYYYYYLNTFCFFLHKCTSNGKCITIIYLRSTVCLTVRFTFVRKQLFSCLWLKFEHTVNWNEMPWYSLVWQFVHYTVVLFNILRNIYLFFFVFLHLFVIDQFIYNTIIYLIHSVWFV